MKNPRAVFNQVNVIVGDVRAAVAFYELLGVDIPEMGEWAHWAEHHRNAVTTNSGADFELDSATFAPKYNAGWAAGQTGVVLGFRVAGREDVDAAFIRMSGAGYKALQPPFDAFWGARYAIVEDPAGNAVGVMSDVDPARRTAPPDPATF